MSNPTPLEAIPNDPKKIAAEYFAQHVGARDGVMKAWHAYHVVHFTEHPQAHNFPGTLRVSMCVWCGRSREQVRHDNLPAECGERPNAHWDIEQCVKEEEQKAWSLVDSAAVEVPKLVTKLGGMSGEVLAILHNTYGYDPEIVETVLPDSIKITVKMRDKYEQEMEAERRVSRLRQARETITALGQTKGQK